MAYSELIKNFDRIRDYMRQFYIERRGYVNAGTQQPHEITLDFRSD